ncbi:MAG TPA: malto-oligosyltrehalose synthase [Acidobacteriaceae bacterium]|nr:malto-oligosyltrehalose synthase [Acidobacteriaceae bacterium]
MKDRRSVSATYRLQLTNKFRFADAEAIIPYLRSLGISHIYASPIFEARPGSLSGYDTCDFSRISPELGGEEGFNSLVTALHAQRMGLIIDFVPNHMSAHPQWNKWWRSVLANGPSSSVSEYFDVDWNPVNSNLHGKVLLAILGGQYGDVLESGDLKIGYHDGEFCLLYGDYNLPLNPRQMKVLLRHRWHEVAESSGVDDATRQEFESILFHLDHIPGYQQAGLMARVDRERETAVATQRLTRVMQQSPALRKHLEEVIAEYNGVPGQPESFDLLHELLEQQPYRLSYWRTAMQEINYRRFFDINDLIGLRMEYEPLFRAAHAKLIELAESGMIDGVRLDHIDGLLDPQQYLLQLRAATANSARPMYLIVEKILARQEWLSPEWPVDGSTGYEFLALLNGLWVNEPNLHEIDQIYLHFRERRKPDRDAVYNAKKLITASSMASELNVLAHELNLLSEENRRSRDFTLDGLQEALREVVACFPVYRTYISAQGFSTTDEMAIDEAIGQARRRNPSIDYSIFEFIRSHICPVRQPEESEEDFAERLRFAMKFQQYTSPVQAKGMEDTVFYRYSPLASLNEVGTGTGRRATTPQEFHDANIHRMERWPNAMLTTSTHDTKRGEDARMRIHVLTELPEEWKSKLLQWSHVNEGAKTLVNGHPAPDHGDEYLYYQTLLGMWPPLQKAPDDDTVNRMQAFMGKALREAKVHTSWVNPSNEYDAAVEKFVQQTLCGKSSTEFLASFVPFAERIATLAAWESVSQIALKLMSPGVIDTYQGGELWDLSLVDPDNRRPVDFETRRQRLRVLTRDVFDPQLSPEQRSEAVASICQSWWSGDVKMLYVAQGLRLREKEPDLLLRGSYHAMNIEGPTSDHIIAFAREYHGKVLLTIATRWFASLLPKPVALADIKKNFQQTFAEISGIKSSSAIPKKFANVLTGATVDAEVVNGVMRLNVADSLDNLPAVWLIGEQS